MRVLLPATVKYCLRLGLTRVSTLYNRPTNGGPSCVMFWPITARGIVRFNWFADELENRTEIVIFIASQGGAGCISKKRRGKKIGKLLSEALSSVRLAVDKWFRVSAIPTWELASHYHEIYMYTFCMYIIYTIRSLNYICKILNISIYLEFETCQKASMSQKLLSIKNRIYSNLTFKRVWL